MYKAKPPKILQCEHRGESSCSGKGACLTATNLIDGKSNGLHVFSLSSFLPAVLLHEADQEAAV